MNRTKIRQIVRSITSDTRVFFKRGDCCYYNYELNKINIDPLDLINDCGFMRHLLNVHNISFLLWARYSLGTWSILHELGHHFCDEWTDETEEDEFTRFICSMIPREEATIKQQDRYFNLPREYNATEWAINFATEHRDLCDLLEKYLSN